MTQPFHAFFEPDTAASELEPVCPGGCHIRTTTTDPAILRALIPHHSHWQEISAAQFDDVPTNVPTKTFVQDGKSWTEVRGGYRPRRTQTTWTFIQPPSQPGIGGGGGGVARKPVTQDMWLSAVSEASWNDTLTVPEASKQYKQLKVIVLPAHKKDIKLYVKFMGAGSGRQLWSNDPTTKSETTFEKIDINKPITLGVDTSEGKRHAVFVNQTHSILIERKDTLFTNQSVNAPVFVIDYQVNGDLPVITLSPEPPQMGIFFDGTGNNMSNDNKDAYDANAPTNVVKLFELYAKETAGVIDKQYIEGVGTEAGKKDSDLDKGFAYTFGRRIKDAISELRRYSSDYSKLPQVIVDVFGFSRGAAQARAFINEVKYITNKNPGYWGGAKIQFRFAGLFDSVASIDWPGNDKNNFFIAQKGLEGPINLNLSEASAEKIVHLTAIHEYREYFPLHSLKTESGSMPGNFIEETYPGAHSDIGGGYGPVEQVIHFPKEIHFQDIPGFPWTEERIEAKTAEIKQKRMNKYNKPGLKIEVLVDTQKSRFHGSADSRIIYKFYPVWRRKVNVELAHIPLKRMHELALVNKVPLEPLANLSTKGRHGYVYQIPGHLSKIVNAVKENGDSAPEFNELYQGFIHHSHQYAPAIGGLANPHTEESDKNIDTTKNGVRELFYNKPDKAITT